MHTQPRRLTYTVTGTKSTISGQTEQPLTRIVTDLLS